MDLPKCDLNLSFISVNEIQTSTLKDRTVLDMSEIGDFTLNQIRLSKSNVVGASIQPDRDYHPFVKSVIALELAVLFCSFEFNFVF